MSIQQICKASQNLFQRLVLYVAMNVQFLGFGSEPHIEKKPRVLGIKQRIKK